MGGWRGLPLLAQQPSWSCPTPSVPSHLLSFQGEFDEDLLQLLVDKVDAELLKAVFLPREAKGAAISGLMLETPGATGPPQEAQGGNGVQAGEQRPYLEDLEAIDVKHTNTVLLLGLLHSAVDGLQGGRGQ